MRKILILLLLAFIPLQVWGQPGRKKVQAGNQLFNAKKYEEANTKYQDALLEAPESPVIQYNLGGSQYKIGKFEEALENYTKATSTRLVENQKPDEERRQRSMIHYNRGNTYYRMNKYLEAINEYREALKLNPADQDAKYNLEFVRNKLKNQAQQQPQDQNQQQQQQQQPQQQNQNQDQPQSDQKKDNQKQSEQQPQPQVDKKEMSKEDAERVLNALREDEKQEQKKRKMNLPVDARRMKDW